MSDNLEINSLNVLVLSISVKDNINNEVTEISLSTAND